MNTMPGTSFQLVCRVNRTMMPTATPITATSSRKPALDGRRPTWTGSSGSTLLLFAAGAGRLPLGVARPEEPVFPDLPELRRRSAMASQRSGGRTPDAG